MRHLLCQKCAARYLPEGTREVFKRTRFEPAEFQRLTVGIAGKPTAEQRTIFVNGDPIPQSLDFFECDECNAQINPGEQCAARTVWREDQGEIGKWEQEYFAA
jgi:hypothetical protein